MIPGQSLAQGARRQPERFSAALSAPRGLAAAAVAPQPNRQDRHHLTDRQAKLLVCARCGWLARPEDSPCRHARPGDQPPARHPPGMRTAPEMVLRRHGDSSDPPIRPVDAGSPRAPAFPGTRMITTGWAVPPLSGRYLLESRVGAGGMGVVWRARDIRLDRIVAVKVLRPEFAGSPEFRDLLLWEGRLAGRVSHPGVIQVRDYGNGSAGGGPYLVMEYVAGPSLAAVLSAEGTLSPRRVLGLIAQAAEALACAHAAGIVHRDVKPGNVLVDDGRVKIADFGIAQAAGAVPVTRAGLVMGTPAYLPPEQAAGLPATPAGDLYGLGMIAYECLTGGPPFRGSPSAVALAHMDRPLPPLPDTVPAPVAELVAALAAKDPRHRPGDALAVAEWAWRVRDDPQVLQAVPAPSATADLSSPTEPASGITGSPNCRVTRRPAAAVFPMLAAWASRTAQHRIGHPPAHVPGDSHRGLKIMSLPGRQSLRTSALVVISAGR
jgi:serine/threonine protein kinase